MNELIVKTVKNFTYQFDSTAILSKLTYRGFDLIYSTDFFNCYIANFSIQSGDSSLMIYDSGP